VTDGEQAARDGRWDAVGTANIRFHKALTSLAGAATAWNGFMTGSSPSCGWSST